MRPPFFPIETLDHVDEWVAFSNDMKSVAGYGKTFAQASAMARNNGEKRPVFFFVASHLLKVMEPIS